MERLRCATPPDMTCLWWLDLTAGEGWHVLTAVLTCKHREQHITNNNAAPVIDGSEADSHRKGTIRNVVLC